MRLKLSDLASARKLFAAGVGKSGYFWFAFRAALFGSGSRTSTDLSTETREMSENPATLIEPLAVNVAVAAKMIGISRGALYPLLMGGQVESLLVGTRRIVPVASLRRWLQEQAAAGRDGAS